MHIKDRNMSESKYDKIIIGAGLYGLYSAYFCAIRGQHILVLECDPAPFKRATYINQARVHQGYHYPRSLSTAMKSAGYFEKFNRDYGFCINQEFKQIYATSSEYSWSDGAQFRKFCEAAGIPCEELQPGRFFKEGMCDGAFLTREYTYDAMILRDYFLEKLKELAENVRILYGVGIERIEKSDGEYDVYIKSDDGVGGQKFSSGYVLNATYASTNQILDMLGFEKFIYSQMSIERTLSCFFDKTNIVSRYISEDSVSFIKAHPSHKYYQKTKPSRTFYK